MDYKRSLESLVEGEIHNAAFKLLIYITFFPIEDVDHMERSMLSFFILLFNQQTFIETPQRTRCYLYVLRIDKVVKKMS